MIAGLGCAPPASKTPLLSDAHVGAPLMRFEISAYCSFGVARIRRAPSRCRRPDRCASAGHSVFDTGKLAVYVSLSREHPHYRGLRSGRCPDFKNRRLQSGRRRLTGAWSQSAVKAAIAADDIPLRARPPGQRAHALTWPLSGMFAAFAERCPLQSPASSASEGCARYR